MPLSSEEEYRYAQERLASGELTPEQQARAQRDVAQYDRLFNPQKAEAQLGATFRDEALVMPTKLREGSQEERTVYSRDLADMAETQGTLASERAAETAAFRAASQEEFAPPELRTTGLALPEDLDQKLQSASKRKGLYRPPELMQTDVGSSRLGAVFDSLPSSIGGRVVEYMEPTFEQFQRDTAEVRPQLEAMGFKNLDDPRDINTERLFNQYADQQWQQIYDEAQKNGTAVSRVAHRGNPQDDEINLDKGFVEGVVAPLGNKARNVYSKGLDATASASMGALNHGLAVLPGGGEAIASAVGGEEGVEALRSSVERNKGANLVGSLAGALSPLAASTRLTTGIAGTVAGPGASLARRAAGAALGGSAGGAYDAAGNSVMGDLASGDEADLGKAGEEALTGAAYGATLGTAGELAGSAAAAGRRALRNPQTGRGQDIRTLEEAGGELGVLGPKRSPGMKAIADRAGARQTEYDVIANDLAPEVVEGARTQEQTIRATAEADNARWRAQNPGAKVSAKPFAGKLVELIKRNMGSDDEGLLPFANNGKLKQLFDRSMVVKELPPEEAHALVARGEGILLDPGPPSNALGGGSLVKRPATLRVARPRDFSADDIDQVVSMADDLAKIDQAKPGDSAREYRELARAIRETRDQLPGNYSGMKAQHEQSLSGHERDVHHALGLQPRKAGGLPEYGDLLGSEVDAVRGKIKGYDQAPKGNQPGYDALYKFAESRGVADELAKIPALDAFKNLEQRSKVVGSPHVSGAGNVYGAGRLEGIALRSDPLLKKLAETPVSPELRSVLRQMRRGKVTAQTSPALGDLGQLRGGGIGTRGAAVASEALTEEDIDNLGRLIKAVELEKQAPPPPE